jgi:hypothetical protein
MGLWTLMVTAPANAQCPPGGIGAGGQYDYDPYYYNRYYYSPHKFRNRPRLHQRPNETGLSYYRFNHPYSDYEYYKRTYPHTIDGTFGRPPQRPRDLTLRFRQSPGFSPFSRYHHEDALFGTPQDAAPAPAATPGSREVWREYEIRQQPRTPQRPRDRGPNLVRRPQVLVYSPGPKRDPSHTLRDESRAWSLLAEGRGEPAQFAFCAIALAYPEHGRPKAGYGLARAIQGDHAEAVWNMRRAMRFDGPALRHIPLDDRLTTALRELLAGYGQGDHSLSETDTLFMSAALHLVLDEPAEAREAAEALLAMGDFDASVLALLVLLRDAPGTGIPPHQRRPDLHALNMPVLGEL